MPSPHSELGFRPAVFLVILTPFLSCAAAGSAAILLTNKRSERRRAKYSLEHVVRVHLGADDTAFQ